MKYNKLILISVLIGLFSVVLKSQDYTNYSLTGGLGLGLNQYISNFKQLPNIKNSCPDFDYANGIGLYMYIGGIYKINSFLAENNLRYTLQLGYSNYSAKYKINEDIGNDLSLSSYQKIYVDHILDIGYSVVSIENYISARPVKDLPLDIKFGFIAGMPISKTYKHEEDLVEPGDVFFKDGSKIRNMSNRDLPDPSSMFLGLGFGAKYEIYKVRDIIISPEIQFIYGMTSPVKSLNWNITSIKGGISVQFNIPKASEIRHAAPPLQKMPRRL